MAGISKGIALDLRGDSWRARFSHEGKRYSIATGESDKGAARRAAEKARSEILLGHGKSGPAKAEQRGSGLNLADLLPEWEISLDSRLAHLSVVEYMRVAMGWRARWSILGEITVPAIGKYQDELLKRLSKETTRKYGIYLRRFLDWCKREGHLKEPPTVPVLDRLAIGKPARAEREAVILTPAEVKKLLKALPETSPGFGGNGKGTYRVRDYYEVLWETALRPHATVEKLESPKHYKTGERKISLTPDIDKARNATRKRKGKIAVVPISKKAADALTRSVVGKGPIFGEHSQHRAEILKEVSKRLGKEVRDYDFKHSRITHWFRMGIDPVAISYRTGVRLDTLIEHYAHPSEEAADEAPYE